jgi:hypothetical protein
LFFCKIWIDLGVSGGWRSGSAWRSESFFSGGGLGGTEVRGEEGEVLEIGEVKIIFIIFTGGRLTGHVIC